MGLERLPRGIIFYEGRKGVGWWVAGFTLTMLEWLLGDEGLSVSQWIKLDYLAALYLGTRAEGRRCSRIF